jgi:hypothetical protein
MQQPEAPSDERRRFPELDDAARRRAEARAEKDGDRHAAYAAESVAVQMLRAYN